MVTVKKIFFLLVVVVCASLTGCNFRADKSKNKLGMAGDNNLATNSDGDRSSNNPVVMGEGDQEQVDLEKTTENVQEDMSVLRDYQDIDNKKYAWYIVRNDDHKISGWDQSFSLEQYDAYCADLDREEVRNEAEKESKVMYFTFDCGYENGYTEQMLDILKKYNAKACFFVTQTYIRDNPDIVKRMKKEGHQVGNHTVSHPSMPDISVEEQKQELKKCSDFMKEATGYEMDKYMRPPSGEYSQRVLQLCKDMGYKTIFWSMAYLDYDVEKQPGKEYVLNHFMKYHHDGAFVLMHNCSSSNAEALDEVLSYLTKEGYSFISLDEMFEK